MPIWTAFAVQAVVGAILFGIGRWRWLGVYALVWPLFWLIPSFLASLHCLGCEYAAWYLPVVYLILAVVRKAAITARAAEERELTR